jgi:ATP-dependent helicase/nuclease subunit A
MTRARERLVFSATPPRTPIEPSWWRRVEPVATAWEPPSAAPGDALATVPIELRVVPRRPLREASPVEPPSASAADTATAALGRAVHRVMEWYGADPGAPVAALAAAAAADLGADAGAVASIVRRMLEHPDTAAFFGGAALRWAGNEVSVGDAGRTQRIDRLVLLESAGERTWWVLDYKIRHDPAGLAAYREQLLRYRALVARAQPGDTVRCAFIAGSGERIEIAPGSGS